MNAQTKHLVFPRHTAILQIALCTSLTFAALSPAFAGAPSIAPTFGSEQTAPDQPPEAPAVQPEQPASAPAPAVPPASPQLSPQDLQAIDEVREPARNLLTTIETLERAVDRNRTAEDELGRARLDIEGLIDGSELTADLFSPRLDALKRQIEKLGAPPAKGAEPEAQQIAQERQRLQALAAETSGALKTVELVQVRAQQLYSEVQKLRQGIFAGEILRRSPSPLSTTTWQLLFSELPGTFRQVSAVASSWMNLVEGKWLVLASVLAAALLVYLGLKALARGLLNVWLPRDRDPEPAFFEQAGTAGWVAPVFALAPTIGVLILWAGLDALELLKGEVGAVTTAGIPALGIFIGASALARAVLQPTRRTWRLINVSDPTARTLNRTISQLAAVYAADIVLQEVIRQLYLPLSISVVETAAASVATAYLLIRLVRTPFEPKPNDHPTNSEVLSEPQGYAVPGASIWQPLWIKGPLLALALLILALSLIGYLGLGRFLAAQVVVSGSAVVVVLLFHLGLRALFGGPGTGRTPLNMLLQEHLGLSPGQSLLLTQALAFGLNALLALCAVPLLLLTWGYSTAEALSWLQRAIFGFEVGDFRISLARIVLAIALFLTLVMATRLAQRWLADTLVRTQKLDQGIVHSIHTGVGYAGSILALLIAVSYGGLDVTNFAIVAGALSVGIGFGLQSIVNNFVSGLILLVERPIKVGDLVSVKGQEGYVRRIAVRSTEIETFDKASLIVPNSDLITSAVTNWTHRNALGRARVRVTVGSASDPEHVSQILTRIGQAQPNLLKHPAPFVSFDNFGPNGLEFSLTGTVPDVNSAGTVESNLRIEILKAFRAAQIELPNTQHDIHLKDLTPLKSLLLKALEARAQSDSDKPHDANARQTHRTFHDDG